VRFVTVENRPWAKSGHEIAWQQFVLPAARPKPQTRRAQPAANPVELREKLGGVELRAGAIAAVFDESTATLASYSRDGRGLLARGPLLQLWRGATDNDGIKLWSPQGPHKALGRWLALGLPRLQHRVKNFSWRRNRDGSVTVELRHAASGRERWDDALHAHRYTLSPDGTLRVDNELFFAKELTDLPRVGVCLQLAKTLARLRYFGRGPRENYADRKSAELIGIYAGAIDDEYVPYVMPQEHGHHTDTRWLELYGAAAGPTLRVTGRPSLEFNVTRFSAEELFAARHTIDLTPRAEALLYLDARHRGLGTASCGPDTLEKYQVHGCHQRFVYELSAR
jgi:beta-galactosidase